MAKRKGITGGTLAVLAIAAIAVVGLGVSGTFSFQDGGDNVQQDQDAVADLQIKAQDTLADTQSFVAADYFVYNQDGVQVASGTTSASNFTKVSGLTEGEQYTVRVEDDDGSGDDYYHAKYTVQSMPETTKYVKVGSSKTTLLNEESGVTLSVDESSGATKDDATLKMASGDTETFTLEMEASAADALFNSPKVFLKTNDTAAIDDIKVVGQSQYTIPDRLEATFTEGYTTGISAVRSTDSSKKTVKVEVTADSNTDPSSVELTAHVADATQTKNSQGNWITAVEDSSDSDIGALDSTQKVTIN